MPINDWEEFDRQFEQDYQEPEETEETEVEETEDETPEVGGEETEEVESPEGEEETEDKGEEDLQPPATSDPKAYQAFQAMRQRLEESEKQASIIRKIAEQNNMTPQQVVEAYEQRMLEEQAQQQNTSPEVLQRLSAVEQENATLRQQERQARINAQIVEVQNKYELQQQDIQDTIRKIAEQGYNIEDVDRLGFENVYRIVNVDNIVEREIERERQRQLEEKAKKQKTSTIPVESSESLPKSEEEEIAEMVRRDLKELGHL